MVDVNERRVFTQAMASELHAQCAKARAEASALQVERDAQAELRARAEAALSSPRHRETQT